MVIPKAGSDIQIVSIKHDRTFHRRWVENTVFYSNDQIIIGGNNQTMVEEATKTWVTKEPAIFYFHQQHWFNIVIIFQQPTNYYYYCNICSPFTYQQQTLQYIDYDIDVIVEKDLSYKIVDEQEYVSNKNQMNYPKTVQHHIEQQLESLQRRIRDKQEPFNDEFVNSWYHKLMNDM